MKHCQTASDNIFPELIKRGKPEDTDSPGTREGQAETWLLTVKPSWKRSWGDKVGGCWGQALRVLHNMPDPALKLYHYQALKVQIILSP